jgi:hypothetical protein
MLCRRVVIDTVGTQLFLALVSDPDMVSYDRVELEGHIPCRLGESRHVELKFGKNGIMHCKFCWKMKKKFTLYLHYRDSHHNTDIFN